MATGHCPKCNARRSLLDASPEMRGEVTNGLSRLACDSSIFVYGGRGSIVLSPSGRAFKCGLVWTHLQPEDLRTFIDKHGNAEAKRKLSAFQKGPQEQDLV